MRSPDENPNLADLADRASSETDRAIELRARDRQRKLISKIDAALERIEDGTYGYCEETGEPISLKRLDARPIATLSHRGAGAPRAARAGLSRRMTAIGRASPGRIRMWMVGRSPCDGSCRADDCGLTALDVTSSRCLRPARCLFDVCEAFRVGTERALAGRVA